MARRRHEVAEHLLGEAERTVTPGGEPEFMSLDGVIDAPTWTFEYGSSRRR